MKIVHWNTSKEDQPMTGIKRYEDELFTNVKRLLDKEKSEWHLERIQRSPNKYLGSTPVSWLLRYRCDDADVVHATNEVIAPALYFRKPKKSIVTVHGLVSIIYPSTIKNISDKIQWKLTPKALKKADRIIAISEFTKREILRITKELGVPIEEDKVRVVYHGIDHSTFRPMDKEKCKKRFSLNADEKHILVVLLNMEMKRMDVVKRVFEHVRREREDVKLVKVGEPVDILREEGIIDLGFVAGDEMPALYNAADVYFHPSEFESFGLPVLEAIACGVPVVTSNKATIPEIVGSCGEMVDLDSADVVEQFAEKILNSLDKGVDFNAVERGKLFSWEKTAKKTIKVYEGLIG